jgi:hypothetical protein
VAVVAAQDVTPPVLTASAALALGAVQAAQGLPIFSYQPSGVATDELRIQRLASVTQLAREGGTAHHTWRDRSSG